MGLVGGVFQYRVDEDGVQTFPFISKGAMHMSVSLSDGDSNFKSGKASPTAGCVAVQSSSVLTFCTYKMMQFGSTPY